MNLECVGTWFKFTEAKKSRSEIWKCCKSKKVFQSHKYISNPLLEIINLKIVSQIEKYFSDQEIYFSIVIVLTMISDTKHIF